MASSSGSVIIGKHLKHLIEHLSDQFIFILACYPSLVTNTEVLGSLLYTRYFYLFQGAGVVLLIAMIGAIVLTLRQRDGVRRQVIANQVQRRREESIEIKSVKSKTGIKS